jgi:ribonuclease BN (tRNA processing enzyme)
MRLVTLGTGTVALTPERVCAGHFIETGDVRLLLDCGSGVTHRLAELGLPWRRITHVAITHFHTDHIADFITLAFAWKYGDLPGRIEQLILIGPVGLAELVEKFIGSFGDLLR